MTSTSTSLYHTYSYFIFVPKLEKYLALTLPLTSLKFPKEGN